MQYLNKLGLYFCVLLLVGCGNTALIYTTNDEVRSVKDDGSNDRRVINDPRGRAAWRPGRTEAVVGLLRAAPNCDTAGVGLFEVPASGGSASGIAGNNCAQPAPGSVSDCAIVDPDISKLGNIVATQDSFSSGCESQGKNIITMAANGSAMTYLGGVTGQNNTGARWSPSGTEIVFESGNKVLTMDSNGQNICTVTPAGGSQPTWGTFQGGAVIAFISDDDVFVATPSGTGICPSYSIRQVTNTSAKESRPVWVGSLLAVVRDNGSGSSLELINPSSGALFRTLTTHDERIFHVDW